MFLEDLQQSLELRGDRKQEAGGRR